MCFCAKIIELIIYRPVVLWRSIEPDKRVGRATVAQQLAQDLGIDPSIRVICTQPPSKPLSDEEDEEASSCENSAGEEDTKVGDDGEYITSSPTPFSRKRKCFLRFSH